ncbi:hypothetical protein [Xanthomonas euvesicatoria]|uniref:hypothetical protein n=1 Tax=Xanthomonas euvesicatoria TaxID=456327 RepID=UPI001E31BD42|nr:hypothetical protein [Xanthomonas euvesicatoria]
MSRACRWPVSGIGGAGWPKAPWRPPGELPLRVQPVAAPDSAATVQLHLAGGMRLSLVQVDPAWLVGLLRALGAC